MSKVFTVRDVFGGDFDLFRRVCEAGDFSYISYGFDTPQDCWDANQGIVFVEKENVPCPVCHGAKQLPYQPTNGCRCCKGQGVISKERNEILAKIRADLSVRLGRVHESFD